MQTETPTEIHDDLCVLPNGKLNLPYLLANGNLLFKAGEYSMAMSLFRLVLSDQKWGHCGYYALGMCLMMMHQYPKALNMFEKAFQRSRDPYIALALIDAIKRCEQFDIAEKLAFELICEYSDRPDAIVQLKAHYKECLIAQKMKN